MVAARPFLEGLSRIGIPCGWLQSGSFILLGVLLGSTCPVSFAKQLKQAGFQRSLVSLLNHSCSEDIGMRIRDLLDEATVKVPLESVDKEECLEEMVDLLVRSGRISDRQAALKALLKREAQATTGIGKGIALPHAKHDSISDLVVAIGVSKDGIEFDSVDDELVHFVVLLLANTSETGSHLRTLVEVARLVEVPGFFRKALDCKTSSELLDLIDSEE